MLWLFAPENRIYHFRMTWPVSLEWYRLDLERFASVPCVVWCCQLVLLAGFRRSPPPRLYFRPGNQPDLWGELAGTSVVVRPMLPAHPLRRTCPQSARSVLAIAAGSLTCLAAIGLIVLALPITSRRLWAPGILFRLWTGAAASLRAVVPVCQLSFCAVLVVDAQ